MVVLKQYRDCCTNTPAQFVVLELLRRGIHDRRLPEIRNSYRRKRDRMLAAIQRRFPAHVRWNRPEGGFFVWVALPSPLDGEDLLQRAVQHDVAFVAGRPFFADGTGRETIRLSFSQAPDDVIDAAIAELGSIIGARLQAWAL